MLHSTFNTDIIDDKTTVAQCVARMAAIFGLDENIHRYTGKLGHECRVTLYPMMQKHQLSKEQSLDAVCTRIWAFSGYDVHVKKVIDTIKANHQKVEKETGLNVATLLCDTWTLAVHSSVPNAKNLVIVNLKHNYQARGGCLAGISARLIQPFSQFLLSALHDKVNNFAFDEPNNDDIQMQLAIAASLEPSAAFIDREGFPEIVIEEQSEQDDDLLAQAIALSLEEPLNNPLLAQFTLHTTHEGEHERKVTDHRTHHPK